jgi:hypothetical protein
MVVVASEIEARRAIVQNFPGLAQSPFQITSEPTSDYNCIAWAVGENDQWRWPTKSWPPSIGRAEKRANFVRFFQGYGYKSCDNPEPEDGFEKIALYENDGVPTHAARLLPNGWWTSKLGGEHDISHSLDGLNGDDYGQPVAFMRRPTS